jgi:hypothetical protein
MSDEIRAAQRERIAELEAELEVVRGEALEWRLACDQWRGMTIEQQADYGQLQAEVERVRGDLHQREEQQ